jgi:hypothetical protein
MLMWVLVAVVPIALLGSVLGTSRSGRRRYDVAEETTWWATEGERNASPERPSRQEKAVDG